MKTQGGEEETERTHQRFLNHNTRATRSMRGTVTANRIKYTERCCSVGIAETHQCHPPPTAISALPPDFPPRQHVPWVRASSSTGLVPVLSHPLISA